MKETCNNNTNKEMKGSTCSNNSTIIKVNNHFIIVYYIKVHLLQV